MIVDVLAQFTASELPRIDVAWYGEHREEGTVPPHFCSRCQVELPKLLQKYNHVESSLEREIVLNKNAEFPLYLSAGGREDQAGGFTLQPLGQRIWLDPKETFARK